MRCYNLLWLTLVWLACITAISADEAEDAELVQPVPVRAVAFSPDGVYLAVGYGDREMAGGLLIWNVSQQRAENRMELKPGVSSLSFSPNGKLLALSQYSQSPRLLKWPSLVPDAEFDAAIERSRDDTSFPQRGPVAFSSDSSLLAMSCEDHNVYCWDVASRSMEATLKGHRENAYTIAFSSDSRRIASAAQSGVLVWDAASGEKQVEVKHGSWLNSSVAFSPDGRWLITGGWDGSFRQWNATTGTLRSKVHGWGGVDSLVYSAPASTLAVIGTGKALALYDLSFEPPSEQLAQQIAGAMQQLDDDSYELREAASASLIKAGLFADAELARLTKESPSAEVRIRARRARQAVGQQRAALLQKHTGRTRCLALDPTGMTLATGADDGTVQLWDMAARKHLQGFLPAK